MICIYPVNFIVYTYEQVVFIIYQKFHIKKDRNTLPILVFRPLYAALHIYFKVFAAFRSFPALAVHLHIIPMCLDQLITHCLDVFDVQLCTCVRVHHGCLIDFLAVFGHCCLNSKELRADIG